MMKYISGGDVITNSSTEVFLIPDFAWKGPYPKLKEIPLGAMLLAPELIQVHFQLFKDYCQVIEEVLGVEIDINLLIPPRVKYLHDPVNDHWYSIKTGLDITIEDIRVFLEYYKKEFDAFKDYHIIFSYDHAWNFGLNDNVPTESLISEYSEYTLGWTFKKKYWNNHEICIGK